MGNVTVRNLRVSVAPPRPAGQARRSGPTPGRIHDRSAIRTAMTSPSVVGGSPWPSSTRRKSRMSNRSPGAFSAAARSRETGPMRPRERGKEAGAAGRVRTGAPRLPPRCRALAGQIRQDARYGGATRITDRALHRSGVAHTEQHRRLVYDGGAGNPVVGSRSSVTSARAPQRCRRRWLRQSRRSRAACPSSRTPGNRPSRASSSERLRKPRAVHRSPGGRLSPGGACAGATRVLLPRIRPPARPPRGRGRCR